jgi:hypothetical protein
MAIDNYLINGGFEIAQRIIPGQLTTIASDQMGADRWRVSVETAGVQYTRQDNIGTATPGLAARFNGFYGKITAAGKLATVQPVESLMTASLTGQTVIFQVTMKTSVARTMRLGILELSSAGTADAIPYPYVSAWNGATVDPTWAANLALRAPNAAIGGTIRGNAVDCPVTTAYQTFTGVFTLGATTKNVLPIVFSDTQFAGADTLQISQCVLQSGAAQVPWVEPPIQQTIAACERFYEKSYDIDTPPGTSGVVGFLLFSGWSSIPVNNYYGYIPYRTRKRNGVTAGNVILYSFHGVSYTASQAGGTDLASGSAYPGYGSEVGCSVYNNSGVAITPAAGGFWVSYTSQGEI